MLAVGVLRSEPGRVDQVERADAALRRVRRTIDKLLDFAAAGGEPRPDASCEVGPIVDEVLADLAGTLTQAGVRVDRDVDASLRVGMDGAHLGAVVSNLVTNAAKYGRSGSDAHVRISATRSGAGWAEISVADDGPGIPASALPRVFEPLFRATSKQGGYGLGLATTKRLVEAHGGKIAIDSAANRGTTVRVRLPAARASS